MTNLFEIETYRCELSKLTKPSNRFCKQKLKKFTVMVIMFKYHNKNISFAAAPDRR